MATPLSTLFKSPDEIEREIEEIKDVLFAYNTENAEEFSRQIGEIEDREVIIGLKNALINAKSLYNVIRLQGNYEFIESLDFEKLNLLLILFLEIVLNLRKFMN